MQGNFNLFTPFEAAAKNHPSALALEDLNGNSLTYDELLKKIESYATVLSENGIGRDDRVALLADKSPEYIAFIFAILKCGAAYVPVDPNNPLERNEFICADCGVKALLVEKKLSFAVSGSRKVEVSNDLDLLLSSEEKKKHKENLAYLFYTSGSTGAPKGVLHTHQSAWAFVDWSIKTFSLSSSDKILSHAPFHFDLSVFDIFATLCSGACLVLTTHKTAANPLLIAEALSQKKITTFYATPSTLGFLREYGKMEKHDYSALHTLLFAGEVFPIPALRQLKGILPAAEFYNLYGPTETNVCTFFKVPKQIPISQTEPFPIGKACSFAKVKVESEGELLVTGSSLMAGYWNDENKTASVLKKADSEIWYSTGDVVEENKEGDLIFVGRKDRMLKRKGYRIEPGEIEQALLKHPGISMAAITALGTEVKITAHLVLKSGFEMEVSELIAFCNKNLPSYMMPDHFSFHKEFPQTSTHKINYGLLAQMHGAV